MQTLGELIKKQREKLGISQRELSRQTGVDNNTIAKLEKGTRKKPNTLALKKIAYILNIDFKKILKLAGYSPEDIDYECSLTTNNITMSSKDGGPILYGEEVVDFFRDIRCAQQAILYLIDNFDFDSLEYNTDNADEMKEAVKRGIPIVRESIENMLDVSNMEITEVKKERKSKRKGDKKDGNK